MADNWTETTFDEAVYTNPPVPMKRGEQYFFVDMKSVEPVHRTVSESEIRKFKGGGSRFMPYDTLMARITPCLENGKIARYVPSDGNSPAHGSTEFIVIRGREGVTDNNFAYYLTREETFRSFAIAQMTGSSGRQRVPVESLKDFIVSLPPLPEQQAIAHILGTLDDKIELNRRMNKTLEEIAKTIFKEWFVKFKVKGEKLKINSKTGLPEGWRVGKLGEELKIAYGGNLPKDNLTKEGFPVFGGNGQIGFYSEFLYEDRQVLISCRGEASGKVNISLPKSFVTNNSLILEIPEGSTINFCFLKYFSLNTDFTNYVSGSAQPQITIEGIKDCPILLPIKEILSDAQQMIKPFEDKMLSNNSQIQTLSRLRDVLLPKLLSGEIRVKV